MAESLGSVNRKRNKLEFGRNQNVNRGIINIIKGKGTVDQKIKRAKDFESKTTGAMRRDKGFSSHMNVSGAIKAHGGRPMVQGGGS